jgi:hypothetical protein
MSIIRRGQVRDQTAPNADRSKLHAKYFEIYNHIKALPAEAQRLLVGQDIRVYDLANMIDTAINPPVFSNSTINIQGDTIVTLNDRIHYQTLFQGGGFSLNLLNL